MLILRAAVVEMAMELIARRLYYSCEPFRKGDKALRRAYRWKNPYRIAKKWGQVYGETPLLTLERIANACHITPDDCVVEMGCGRGRNLLFLRSMFGCKTIGIECIPEFVELSSPIVGGIIEGDMFTFDYSEASVVYLYGTCLSEEEIERMRFPSHVTVVTVSYPLPGYYYTSFQGLFPWGKGDIFINHGTFTRQKMCTVPSGTATSERRGTQGVLSPVGRGMGDL